MRIAHFLIGRCNPDSANGVDKTVFNLTKHQAALGHWVSLLTLTKKSPIIIPDVQVSAYPPLRNPFALPKKLFNDLINVRPDIVHLHSVYIPQNWKLTRWLKEKNIPYVITPNGGLSPAVLKRRKYLKMPYRLLCELPGLNGALFIHSVGDTNNIRAYGVHAPIITVPNGFDRTSIPVNCNTQFLASRIPELKGQKIFLFLGRLDYQHKGLDILLKAFAKSRIHDAALVLAGPDWGGHRKILESLSQRLDITSQVFFIGPIYGNQKFKLMTSADVFVHTSRWEGLPFSVLEAAALGLPCLVTPAANPIKLISKYQAGIEVFPSEKSIADGLKQFVSFNQSKRREMGEKARQMVKNEFDWKNISKSMINQYERLLDSHKPSPTLPGRKDSENTLCSVDVN